MVDRPFWNLTTVANIGSSPLMLVNWLVVTFLVYPIAFYLCPFQHELREVVPLLLSIPHGRFRSRGKSCGTRLLPFSGYGILWG